MSRRPEPISLWVTDVQVDDAATGAFLSFGSADKVPNCVMKVCSSGRRRDHLAPTIAIRRLRRLRRFAKQLKKEFSWRLCSSSCLRLLGFVSASLMYLRLL